jgi:hypothetical protein
MHNMLLCNVSSCGPPDNFPLRIVPAEAAVGADVDAGEEAQGPVEDSAAADPVVVVSTPLNADFLVRMLPRLEWDALRLGAAEVNICGWDRSRSCPDDFLFLCRRVGREVGCAAARNNSGGRGIERRVPANSPHNSSRRTFVPNKSSLGQARLLSPAPRADFPPLFILKADAASPRSFFRRMFRKALLFAEPAIGSIRFATESRTCF